MRTALCKKNWVDNNQTGFIEGKEYKVIKFEHTLDIIKGVQVKSEQGKKIWFWIGSDYFDMPIL